MDLVAMHLVKWWTSHLCTVCIVTTLCSQAAYCLLMVDQRLTPRHISTTDLYYKYGDHDEALVQCIQVYSHTHSFVSIQK